MYSDTGYGDYPQYYPADRKVGGADNYTGWKLLSYKKRTEVSSTSGNYLPVNALDEDFLTCWAAETGDPGEYFMVDLGGIASVNAIQINWDHIGAQQAARPAGGMGAPGAAPAAPGPDTRYQCYEVSVSPDGKDERGGPDPLFLSCLYFSGPIPASRPHGKDEGGENFL